MSKVLLFTIALLFAGSSFAFDQSHKDFDSILKAHVSYKGSQSYVDYKTIKANPVALDKYLSSLSAVKKEDFDKWTAGNKLAFLINAYNAFTIKLIVKNYPVQQIKDLGSFLKSPWKIKFFKLSGKETHLDEVEHVMIRKNFDEPRIHFSVVCASIGCPPLHDFAFTGNGLEKQLKKATAAFLGDKEKNSYDAKKKKLRLSKIFKWYGDDFKKKYGSYLKFVSTRITTSKADQDLIAKDKVSSSWNSYDWNLNGKK